jgi:hypothetical protein
MSEPPHDRIPSLSRDPDGSAAERSAGPAAGMARPRLFTSAARKEASARSRPRAGDTQCGATTPGNPGPPSASNEQLAQVAPPGGAGDRSSGADASDEDRAGPGSIEVDDAHFRFLVLGPHLEL